jgi:anti-anti-sigma factor
MAIEFEYDAGQTRLTIRGELTIQHAAEVHTQLLGRENLAVDLAEISEVDSAGLQLLLAGKRDTGLHLVAWSDPVADALHLTGLKTLMEPQA